MGRERERRRSGSNLGREIVHRTRGRKRREGGRRRVRTGRELRRREKTR